MLTNEPMINTGDSARPAPDAGETQSAPIRLWLVDDNERLRNTIAELLAREPGVECTRSFSSATAVLSALASKSGPDVILLDIQMGPENGLDAVRPIKSLSRTTRVFMFTSLQDSEARRRALEDGASGFLLKRYAIEQIVETIRKPGEFDGSPRPRRKPAQHSPAPGELDQRFLIKQTLPTTSKAKANSDVLDRCWQLLRSFWN